MKNKIQKIITWLGQTSSFESPNWATVASLLFLAVYIAKHSL